MHCVGNFSCKLRSIVHRHTHRAIQTLNLSAVLRVSDVLKARFAIRGLHYSGFLIGNRFVKKLASVDSWENINVRHLLRVHWDGPAKACHHRLLHKKLRVLLHGLVRGQKDGYWLKNWLKIDWVLYMGDKSCELRGV